MRFLVKKEKEKISRKFDLCIVSFIVSSTSLIAVSFVIYKKKNKIATYIQKYFDLLNLHSKIIIRNEPISF